MSMKMGLKTYNAFSAAVHLLPPFHLQDLEDALFLQAQNSSRDGPSVRRAWIEMNSKPWSFSK
jgi:hypothetical protein